MQLIRLFEGNSKMAVELESAANDARRKKQKIDQAKIHTNCFASAAMAINILHGHGEGLDAPTAMEVLIDSAKRVTSGNITEIEQMLMTQAKILDYVFYDALSKLHDLNMMNQIEVFTNIAFRSQSQCRKTLAVLAELKHPRRTTFIKQQNNAINQQVNNGAESKQEFSENNKKFTNEVIAEVTHELKKMDIGTTIETVTANSNPEAVGVFDRTQNGIRKKYQQDERP